MANLFRFLSLSRKLIDLMAKTNGFRGFGSLNPKFKAKPMSHFVTIESQIRDVAALKEA